MCNVDFRLGKLTLKSIQILLGFIKPNLNFWRKGGTPKTNGGICKENLEEKELTDGFKKIFRDDKTELSCASSNKFTTSGSSNDWSKCNPFYQPDKENRNGININEVGFKKVNKLNS